MSARKPHRRPENWRDFIDSLDGVGLSLPERAVLLAHYKYADPDGRNCRASVETIAAYLDSSVSTVTKHRNTLRDKCWLIEKARGHNAKGGDRASLYEVVIPGGVTINAPKPKRQPRNPQGINKHTRVRGKDLPQKLEVKQSSNPRELEVKAYHLPNTPLQGSSEVLPLVGKWVEIGEPTCISGSADADRDVGRLQETLADARGYPQESRPVKRYEDYWTSSPSGEDVDDESPAVSVGSQEQSSAELRESKQWADPWGAPPNCPGCGYEAYPDDDVVTYRAVRWHTQCAESDRATQPIYDDYED